jgi:uncharacterized membrane protein
MGVVDHAAFNKVYSTLRQIAEIFLGSGEDASFRRVALVEYGSPGTHMVGFVTSTAASEAGEKLGTRVCHVFVPSAVNPTTGFLLVVPEEKVRYLEMTPEQAMRMIVSAGSIVPRTNLARDDEQILRCAQDDRAGGENEPTSGFRRAEIGPERLRDLSTEPSSRW